MIRFPGACGNRPFQTAAGDRDCPDQKVVWRHIIAGARIVGPRSDRRNFGHLGRPSPPRAAVAGRNCSGGTLGVGSGLHNHRRLSGAAPKPTIEPPHNFASARRSFCRHTGIQALIFQHERDQIAQFRTYRIEIGLNAACAVGVPVLISTA